MQRIGDLDFPDADRHMSDRYAQGRIGVGHIDAAMALVPKKTLAIDAGAFVGYTARRLAQHFKLVFAFEPAEDSFECLTENTKHIPNVERVRCAIGDVAGFTRMGQDTRWEANTGGRFLDPDNVADTKAPGMVQVKRLDSFDWACLDLLKLDVEGYELFALKGAERALLMHRPVIIAEFKPRLLGKFGVERQAVDRYLTGLGARMVVQIGPDRIYAWS